jgi:predicted XRE-type DNA-binding protein
MRLFPDGKKVEGERVSSALSDTMEQYGYRQQEIASHLGLHYSSVSRIVKGER